MATLKKFIGVAKASIKRVHIKLAVNLKKLVTLDMGGSPFSPSQVSGMVYWFKGDVMGLADGTLIDSMADSSGNGYHADEGSTGSRPTAKTNIQNGLSVARFAGGQGRQFGANPSVEESAFDLATSSIFWAASRSAGQTLIAKNTTAFSDARRRKIQVRLDGGIRAISGADGDSLLLSSGVNTANFHIGAVIAKANNNHDIVFNGAVTNFTNTLQDSTFNDARVEIGQAFANGAERLTGDIGEIIIYSGDVGAAQRAAIIQYLGQKWGVTVS